MLIGIIFVLAILLLTSSYERFTVEREMEARREAKEAELEALKERATALEERVEHLRNERGIEEELRSRLDVAKEGEQVIVIVDDDEDTETDLEELSKPPGGSTNDTDSFLDFLKFW